MPIVMTLRSNDLDLHAIYARPGNMGFVYGARHVVGSAFSKTILEFYTSVFHLRRSRFPVAR